MLILHQAYLTESPCYLKGQKIKVQGIILHSVGCSCPRAADFLRTFSRSEQVAVHAFIDGLTGEVYQTLPWDCRGWHCGGKANNTHISIEMCEPHELHYFSGVHFWCLKRQKAKEVVRRTYASAVELCAWLCQIYHLDPGTAILGHYEAHVLGLASDHKDPRHLWQGLGMAYTMDSFRQEVQKKLSETILIKEDTLQVK